MKTMMFHNIANPRRTTLAHLKDADEIRPRPPSRNTRPRSPTNTANPRRTILMVAPEITPAA
ncbi:hypothetical protein [Streptomyces sp. KL116D]|uniref:hypothetical protein n=1 Tax=Streptomyces sp. KL116D TaxID=3045152 RepID=UPI0035583F64